MISMGLGEEMSAGDVLLYFTLHLYLEMTIHIHIGCLLVVSMRSFSLVQLSNFFSPRALK